MGPGATNQYAMYIEECGGMVAIHALQNHENFDIYKKCFYIMDKYFPDDEEDQDTGIEAPQVNDTGAFAFPSSVATPQTGFQFGPAQNM